jgi:hypothetical protein
MNSEKIKEELKEFEKRILKLLDEEGKECSVCHQRVIELNENGICHPCSIATSEEEQQTKSLKRINQNAVDREKERMDIFG